MGHLSYSLIVQTVVMRGLCFSGESVNSRETNALCPLNALLEDEVEGSAEDIIRDSDNPGKNDRKPLYQISAYSRQNSKLRGKSYAAGNAGLIPAGRYERRLQWISGND